MTNVFCQTSDFLKTRCFGVLMPECAQHLCDWNRSTLQYWWMCFFFTFRFLSSLKSREIIKCRLMNIMISKILLILELQDKNWLRIMVRPYKRLLYCQFRRSWQKVGLLLSCVELVKMRVHFLGIHRQEIIWAYF